MATNIDGMLRFGAEVDFSDVQNSVNELNAQLQSGTRGTEKAFVGLSNAIRTAGGYVASYFSISAIKGFAAQVSRVRGEFQQLEIAFKTMLGDETKANELMTQLIHTAAITPFGMTDITKSAKQLLAYGVAADEVNDTLVRLGDIAAGLSIPIGDLAYLYGTTMVQGRMFTQDLRQFTGRGIPMTEELAKVMGVTKEEVAGLVTAGKIGFEEMKQAIINLTSEGGKFGGLMAEQSKSITGQISNLGDSVEQMFNEIGKKTQGVISGAITQVSKLVENYEQVGKILFELIKIYGTYKAALIVLTVNHNLAAAAASGHTTSELLLAKALNVVKVAQAKLNAVMAKNPYALMAAILTTIIYSSYRLIKAQKELTNAYGETSAKITSETQAMKALFDVARDENRSKKERAEAIDTINARYGDYLDNLIDEKASVEDLNAAYKELAASIANKYLTNLQSSLTEDLQADLADAETSLWSMVGKMATKSGLSANRQGAMTAEMQQWVSQYGKYNSTTEIYDKLTGIYNKYGGEKLSGSQRGRLFGFIEDWKEAGSELQAAEKSFESYKRGYEDTLSGLKTESGESTQPTVFSTITDEITKAREELAKLKTEEQDLRKGIRPEGAKESFSFSSALAENAQQQKEVQERLTNLTGTSSKDTKKAEEEAKKNREAFIKEYGSYEMRLKQLDDEWTTTINSLGKDTPERALAEKQKTYALAAFSYDWLKDNSVDRGAIREALVKQIDAEIATLDGAAKEAAEARKKVTLAEFDVETGSSENEYLKAWGTMQEKRAAISKEYDDKILAAKDEWAKKSLEKEKEGALYDFDTQNSEQMKKFFLDPAKQSKSLLKENIAYAQTLLEKYKDQPDIVKDVNEQLAQMQDEYNGIDFEGYEAGVDGVISRMTELNNLYRKQAELTAAGKTSGTEWEANEAAIERSKKQLKRAFVATGVDEFVGGLQEAAELMQQIADTAEDVNLADAASMLSSFSQNLSSAWEGAKSGGWIGAIVGGVTDWIEQAVGAYTEARVAEAQYAREHEEFIRKINLANLSIDADAYETIFGTLEISKGIEGWQKAQDAIKQYEEYVNKAYTETTAKQKQSDRKMYGGWGGLIFSAGATFNPFKGSDKYTNQYLQQLDAVERGLTELQAMSVKTKSRNGFQKFWGAEDQYKSLIDYAPQLWDEDGAFNVENAKALLETSTKLTDTQKDQIQNAINLKEAYDEAMEAVDESISSMFSSLGEDMSDAIWDSVVNGGEDAWSQFQEIGGETIANLGKQMLKEMIISDFLNEYKEKFREAYQSGDAQDVASNVAQVTADMLTATKDKVDVWSAAVQGFYDQAKASGFDVSDDSERGTTSGGITSMSQESADELNGRFTAIQGHTYQINENVELLKEQHLMLVSNTGAILSHVMGIHSDTSDIRAVQQEMRDTLAEVRSIAKSTSDDILLKGIKIK